ncbi:MAG: hypothetical protein EA406_06465 [Rhodospirillales bacterium]|nr:MAG: hypothetical protein EA406_06465 [Rhodospirillales bacterium]
MASPATTHAAQAATEAVRAAPPAAGAGGTILVRYTEHSPVVVRGTVSGRVYMFSGAAPLQQVDARDASQLLRSRFFRAD